MIATSFSTFDNNNVAHYYSVTNQYEVENAKNQLFTLIPSVVIIKDNLMSSNLQEVKRRVREIATLKEGWDGFGATAISDQVIKNTFRLLDTIYNELSDINIVPDDLTPTPYGSIEIDIETKKGLVSVEIGKRKLGFFTKYINDEDFESEGEETDFKSIPSSLQRALENLF